MFQLRWDRNDGGALGHRTFRIRKQEMLCLENILESFVLTQYTADMHNLLTVHLIKDILTNKQKRKKDLTFHKL